MKWGILGLWLVACGGSEDSGGDGTCDQRSGTYIARYTERSGNCGPVPEQVDTITVQPVAPEPPCSGTISYSADNCQVTFEATCPETGLGLDWSSTTDGKVTWNASASKGSGIVQIVLTNANGGIECQSTYNLVSERL